jgi:two-component system nitrogen regulation response regulator NtrX
MSLATQAKVLRVIQELKFERVGGEESIEVDVRIIAATNKDIEKEIKERRFREDLYFRLNVIPIYVPSLRERIEDLDELVQYFMVRFKRTADNDPRTFSRAAMDILRGYSWPGNIRELKNFIERVNIMSEEKVISPQTVRLNLRILKDSEGDEFYKPFSNMKLNEARDKFEREMLILKLADNDNNISRASESLGITPSSLHNKIRKFGIKINRLI